MRLRKACTLLFGLVSLLLGLLMPFAQAREQGLSFEGSLGLPQASIKNPDGSMAYYQGIALMGGGSLPILEAGLFSAALTGSVRYLDLKNGANGSAQKEFANHLGLGGGLRLQFAKLFIGFDYHMMAARHYSVGPISQSLEYSYSPFSYYGGFSIPLGTLSAGVSYHQASAVIAANQVGLTQSSPLNDSLILIHLRWNTGASAAEFLSQLFN